MIRGVALHYPIGPFGDRFSQLDHYERLQVSRLVEERIVLVQRVAKHMRRNSPSIAMLPMCLDTSLVDTPEFVLVPLIQHCRLAYAETLIAVVEVICTVLEARMGAQRLRRRRWRICEWGGLFPCEAEEVDEDEGGDSDEEKRSPARGHSLPYREQQEGCGLEKLLEKVIRTFEEAEVMLMQYTKAECP